MSTAATSIKNLSLKEYFEFDARRDQKYEYWNGELVALSGGSLNHSRIAGDIARVLENFLEGKPCETFNSDIRVMVNAAAYAYPDVSIACPPLEFSKVEGVETLRNPVAIFEVLSPSSEVRDRGKKLKEYLQMESLLEYLLVSQEEMRVDHLVRNNAGWSLNIYTQPDSTVPLEAIPFNLRLADIYRRVTFPILEIQNSN